MLIRDILAVLEQFAPCGLAMQWDNVGLQVGRREWETEKVLLSLDVTPHTIDYAISNNYNCILSHHPFIFKPIASVTRADILSLIEHRIAVISMHTNLDTAYGGVNHALAEALHLHSLCALSEESGSTWYSGTVYTPSGSVEALLAAIMEAGAGRIGRYDGCYTLQQVQGAFRPLSGSNPHQGSINKPEHVEESRIDFMVDSFCLSAVQQAILSTHPYETPLMHFTKVEGSNPAYGLGLVGELAAPMTLIDFTHYVKSALLAPSVQLWTAGKDEAHLIKKIAVCGGSGGSLVTKAARLADVFVTGDINYHTMLESAIPLVNAGHFHTEYPVLATLQKLLTPHITNDILPLHLHEINHLQTV